MADLPPDWKRTLKRLERDAELANRRADKLQLSVDRLTELLAKQGDELTAIRKMLRRRDDQLIKAEREVRKLRRRLGLDDPDPEPDAAPLPDEASKDDDGTDEAPASGASGGNRALADDVEDTDVEGADEGSSDDADVADDDATTRRKARRGGWRRPPAHLPTEEERHEVCACAHCGGSVHKRDVLETEVY